MTDEAMVNEIIAQLETIFSRPGGLKSLCLGSEVSIIVTTQEETKNKTSDVRSHGVHNRWI